MITVQIGGKISPYEEKTITGKGDDKILLIDISGVITGKSRSDITGIKKEPGMVERIKEQLNKAEDDKKIKAIILRVNTPGGTVTASDIIYHELLQFKKKKGVKIIAAMMDLSTSGGYYLSMSADKIIAHPTTITGSIGVLALKLNMRGLFEKIGIEDETVKSGEKKDITSPFRPFSEEEKEIFQEIIDSLFQSFVNVVKTGRKELSKEEIQKIADGRIYTAQQALKLKMIDQIGYLEDAIELTKKEAGLKETKVITYHRPHQYKENIYSSNYPGAPHTINILNIDMNSFADRMGTKFMYLWMP
tara:strand:- start:14131 stop:15042 length:912 start_codon:yes stop_codon:yes gene_type:complete